MRPFLCPMDRLHSKLPTPRAALLVIMVDQSRKRDLMGSRSNLQSMDSIQGLPFLSCSLACEQRCNFGNQKKTCRTSPSVRSAVSAMWSVVDRGSIASQKRLHAGLKDRVLHHLSPFQCTLESHIFHTAAPPMFAKSILMQIEPE